MNDEFTQEQMPDASSDSGINQGEQEQKQEKEPQIGGSEEQPKNEKENEEIYGKPESYDFSNVQLGEGVTLEPESTKEFCELAGKCNLSQSAANEFVNLGSKLVQKSVSNIITQLQDAQVEQYKLSTNTDPDIGGAKLNEALNVAELAYSEFATPELQEVFNQTGLKYHPEVIKTFRNIGLLMKEGAIRNAGSPSGVEQTPAQILYGN